MGSPSPRPLVTSPQNIVDVVPEALQAGIPFDGIAKLIGVPRQTLYRWRMRLSTFEVVGGPGDGASVAARPRP
jgi:transposase-like protein